MHRISKKASLITLVCVIGLLLAILAPSDAKARYLWQRFHAGGLALYFDRSDAPLAMEIGNYYFGSVVIGNAPSAYDPELAKRAFEKALSLQPGILWGHYSLSRIALAQGDFATALAEADAELAANPYNLRTLYVRGLVYGFRGQPGDLALAEADLRHFSSWAPTEWAGHNDLSWILLREGKYQDVLDEMQTAFQNVPDACSNPWLLNDRGLAYLGLKRYASAESDFSQALHLAEQMSEDDWRRAYSGDNPSTAKEGLASFVSSIATNVEKARANQ